MLLVHGFLATPRVVGSLAYRLRRLGYCPHDVDLGGLFGRFNLDLLFSAAIPSIIHRVLASEEPPERGATQRAVA